jgi:sugar phosphate isomerase/epimerase
MPCAAELVVSTLVRHMIEYALPSRRDFLAALTGGLMGAALNGRRCRGAGASPQDTKPAQRAASLYYLYVMDTGLAGPDVPTIADKVTLAKALGFTGIDFQFKPAELPIMLRALDRAGLELSATYVMPTLENSPEPQLVEALKLLRGRPTCIELCFNSARLKPSDPAGDQRALDWIKRVADVIADSGPSVSVYPHRGSWSERVADGIRLSRAADRRNVGTNFNLVHWKWVKQDKPLDQLLSDALPFLKTVTINGMQQDTIVSLAEGDFDVAGFMTDVKRAGYRGGVGLQGYGIAGPSRAHLARSMTRWREMLPALNGGAA